MGEVGGGGGGKKKQSEKSIWIQPMKICAFLFTINSLSNRKKKFLFFYFLIYFRRIFTFWLSRYRFSLTSQLKHESGSVVSKITKVWGNARDQFIDRLFFPSILSTFFHAAFVIFNCQNLSASFLQKWIANNTILLAFVTRNDQIMGNSLLRTHLS